MNAEEIKAEARRIKTFRHEYIPDGLSMGSDPEFIVTTPSGKTFPSDIFLPAQKAPLVPCPYGCGARMNLDDPFECPRCGGKACYTYDQAKLERGSVQIDDNTSARCHRPEVWLYNDGRQAEAGMHPVTCREYFCRDIAHIVNGLAHAVTDFNKQTNRALHLSTVDGAPITQGMIDRAGDGSKVSGCYPDFCAYNPDIPNEGVADWGHHLYTYAGFHNHASNENLERLSSGFRSGDEKLTEEFTDRIKILDRTCGLVSTFMSVGSGGKERRTAGYGRAGCFRAPKHGLEYRVPGGSLLRSPEIVSIVTGMMRYVNLDVSIMKAIFEILPDHDEVREAIDTNNRAKALELFRKLIPLFVECNAWYSSPVAYRPPEMLAGPGSDFTPLFALLFLAERVDDIYAETTGDGLLKQWYALNPIDSPRPGRPYGSHARYKSYTSYNSSRPNGVITGFQRLLRESAIKADYDRFAASEEKKLKR